MITVLVVLLWARYARLVRGETLSIKERDFIARARESGELRRILDSGIASLKSLWQTLKDIGAITAAVLAVRGAEPIDPP